MKIPKLSVVVLTKNEETNIRDCLNNLKLADEIVVIDNFSTDRTLEIAREFTDKIFQSKLDGIGPLRNFGIEKARGEWVYFVDADDRVSPELAAEILETIKNPSYPAYRVHQRSNYLGRWITACGWYAAVMKLLKKGQAKFSQDKANEKAVVNGEMGTLTNPVHHYGYPDLSIHLRKLSLFSRWEGEALFDKGVRINWLNFGCYFILRPMAKFFQKYIFLRGYGEGIHGLILCIMNAVYVFLIYACVWEIQKSKG